MEITARIVEIIEESPRVKRFIFDFSLDFVPGQWVMLWSDDFCEDGKPIKRAFSVASNPGESLELCIAKGKQFSAFVHDAKVGDEFHIKGPFGNFKLQDNKNVFFIAAGTGIAPFVPMINKAIEEKRQIVLFYSARSQRECLFRDWVDSVRDKIDVIVTLTREECNEFECGRIPLLLPKYFKKGFDYYLCGYADFLDTVAGQLKELGAEHIFFDKWG